MCCPIFVSAASTVWLPVMSCAPSLRNRAMQGSDPAVMVRLMVDWTVGLFFGRSSSELGQLGHPPSLQGYLETPQQASPAEGD